MDILLKKVAFKKKHRIRLYDGTYVTIRGTASYDVMERRNKDGSISRNSREDGTIHKNYSWKPCDEDLPLLSAIKQSGTGNLYIDTYLPEISMEEIYEAYAESVGLF